jgi:hypothetical protein
MKLTSLTLAAAAALMVVSQIAASTSAFAACGHGYKPIKHRSGNTVCVLDVAGGNNKFKAK